MSERQTVDIGIDGGGTGTRLVACCGVRRVEVRGGPSGLALGVDKAWLAIREAVAEAHEELGLPLDWSRCRVGMGLAGVNHAPWSSRFLAAAPTCARLRVESDAFTTLLGAHDGAPGVILALGTGSIGLALFADGSRTWVGGFGFPAGDEASGAWLGLRASRHLQLSMDGRVDWDEFAAALAARVGVSDAEQLLAWLAQADQTRYAELAPVVLEYAAHPLAAALLRQAGEDIGLMIRALDPQGSLPVALCGGLAEPLRPYIAASFAGRLHTPLHSALDGALRLAQDESL